ncbi:hypothetical protein CW304_21375 [Bacillus sp. UFRGS-B20]|nr:hypothetical protein CW304_21375 [Bacillus sp. UFRGS-B20]
MFVFPSCNLHFCCSYSLTLSTRGSACSFWFSFSSFSLFQTRLPSKMGDLLPCRFKNLVNHFSEQFCLDYTS